MYKRKVHLERTKYFIENKIPYRTSNYDPPLVPKPQERQQSSHNHMLDMDFFLQKQHLKGPGLGTTGLICIKMSRK